MQQSGIGAGPTQGLGADGEDRTPQGLYRQRAQIWPGVDQGPQGPAHSDRAAAAELAVSHETGVRARQAWVQEGLTPGPRPKPLDQSRRLLRLDGAGEAELIRLDCGPAPAVHGRWPLHLSADELVVLQVVDSIAKETERQTLILTNCGLGSTKRGP